MRELEKKEKSNPVIHNINTYKELLYFIQDHPKSTIVAKFYKDICPYCKEYTPVFEKLQINFQKYIHFMNINIDEDLLLVSKYKISDLPTTLIIKEGFPYYRRIGIIPYLEMKERLQRIEEKIKKEELKLEEIVIEQRIR